MTKAKLQDYVAEIWVKYGGTAYEFEHNGRYYIKTKIEKNERKRRKQIRSLRQTNQRRIE